MQFIRNDKQQPENRDLNSNKLHIQRYKHRDRSDLPRLQQRVVQPGGYKNDDRDDRLHPDSPLRPAVPPPTQQVRQEV